MSEALARHWQTLRLVPRAPRKIDTATLTERLADRGFAIDQRSVQRDLNKLSALFPLVCDQRSRPYGWSWSAEAESFDMPGMDLHTALTWRLAEAHLRDLLPHALLDDLLPHFARARSTLERDHATGARAWAESVRVLPPGLPRLPAQVDRAVLEAVHDGLLQQRQLDVRYLRRGASEPKDYVVNPLGIVHRDGSSYLVATLWHYGDVLQLALHRMQRAALRVDERLVPEGFALDAYIASGAFGFQVSEAQLDLVAWLDEAAVVRLMESPLAPGQSLAPLEDGRFELRVRLPDTQALRVWLRGHGALCEVREPASLRQELADEAARLTAQYAATLTDMEG